VTDRPILLVCSAFLWHDAFAYFCFHFWRLFSCEVLSNSIIYHSMYWDFSDKILFSWSNLPKKVWVKTTLSLVSYATASTNESPQFYIAKQRKYILFNQSQNVVDTFNIDYDQNFDLKANIKCTCSEVTLWSIYNNGNISLSND
jgi:hypothetical protein